MSAVEQLITVENRGEAYDDNIRFAHWINSVDFSKLKDTRTL